MMGNLWKKDPNAATDLLVDLFAGVADDKPIKTKRAHRKSNARADEYRQKGNQLFQQNQWRDATHEYNECLCYAWPAGDQIAFAYANRAACFLRLRKYEHCLADIEAAIAANYPARLMEKLLKRKADCLAEQQVNDNNRPTKPKLSYAEDANFPGMANVLQFSRKAACCRHVEAKCDIPVGKTVLIEPCFAVVTERPTWDHRCERCQRAGCSLMPCPNCTGAMFCSAECMDDGRAYHGNVCGFDMESREPLELLTDFELVREQLVIQSVSKGIEACNGRINELMAFVADVRARSANMPASMAWPLDKYRAFLQICSEHIFDMDSCLSTLHFACHTYKLMMTLPAFKRLAKTLATQRFLMHLVHMHWMTATKHTIEYEASERRFLCVGTMIKMIANNCYPNTLSVFGDGKLALIALRPIKKGELLSLPYRNALNTSQRRHMFNLLGVPCDCSKCVPAPNSLAIERALEAHPSYQRLRQLTLVDIVDDTAAGRRSIQMVCAELLDFSGKWPHNGALQFIMDTYERYVRSEYDIRNDGDDQQAFDRFGLPRST